MEELIKAMSNADLAELKGKYPDNQSVQTLIDGILATRETEAIQAKAQADFAKGIEKGFAKLAHPDGIHNVYARWAPVEVEVIDEEAKEEEVEMVKTPAVLGKDGEITTPAVMEKVMRKPGILVKVDKWVVEVNKGFQVSKGNGKPTTSKRAVTISKRSEDNPSQLELVGHFASASKACDHLHIPIGGDSATRVLQRDGYFIEPYEGTEYTG